MAAEASLGNIITAASSSDSEVLVLPSSYVPRRVKQFAPKSISFTTTTTPATSSSSSSSSSLHQSQQQQPSSASTSSTNAASATSTAAAGASLDNGYQEDDPCSSYVTLKENEILTSLQSSRLSLLYALPGFGSTSLMVSLIVQIQQDYSDRWVSYIDLRRLAAFMQRQSCLKGENIDEENWTLAGLISAYNKITLPSAIQQINEFFKSWDDYDESGNVEPPILAELFLDELDELTPKMQEVILNIIARDVSWEKCQTRLWISARSHLKSRIANLLPAQVNTYELLPLFRNEQIDLMANYWKITTCPNVADSKLRNFAGGLHDQMEKLIPNFYKSIGACPSHLLQLPDFFTHIVTKLEQDMKENHFSMLDVSVTKIFEKFAKTKFEAYIDKVSCEQPVLAMSSLQFREKEFRKLERLHVRAAISSYPNFKCEPKLIFAGNTHQQEQAHDLYRVGICYEENGQVRFVHPMYAEFLLAQYYVDSGRMKNTTNMCISFFLNNVLFDEECKATRKFFDAYLTIQQQERHKIRTAIVWNRLRCFLIKHYRLNEEACLSSSEEDDDDDDDATATGEDKEQSPKLTFDDIKNSGSVAHLSIMEGHFKIFQMFVDCFKGFPNELRKFLSIKVPLEIFNENPFSKPINVPCNPDVHVVDPFQMLALYGYGTEYMEKFITLWFHYFGDVHMGQYFEDGTWTVVHYAAMNSNCHFLHALFSKERKWERVGANQKNPDGQQPIHMVLTKCWYYSIKIKDHPHPDFRYCTLSGMLQATTSSSSMKMIAIREAINAAVNIKVEPGTEAEPINSTSSSKATTATKRQYKGKASSSPSKSSKKKCKTVIQQKPSIRRRSSGSRTQAVKACKDIWCFEGVDKDFVAAWDTYPDDVEWSPLQPHLACLLLLIENGGDINAPDEVNGKTVLHQAATLESVKLTRFLLQHGADININDDFQRTPVQYATLQKNVNVLEALTEQNNDKNDAANHHHTTGFANLKEMLKSGKHSSMICRIS